MYFYVFIPFSVITAFLILILIFKKDKDASDVILGTWFSAGIFHAAVYYLYVSGISFEHTAFLNMDLPVTLVHGPFLYIYVCLLTKKIQFVRLPLLIHFIPALALYVYQMPFFLMDPADKISYVRGVESAPDFYSHIKLVLIIVSAIFYIGKTTAVYRGYKRIINSGDCESTVNPNWILFILLQGYFIFISILLLDVNMPGFIHSIGTVFTGFVAVYFVVFLAHYGLTRANIYISPERDVSGALERQRMLKGIPAERYRKSGLKENAAVEIERKITGFMKASKPYIDSKVSLYTFAGKIGENPNHVSQVINERMNSSFWDLINRYRIEEFKLRVEQVGNKEETILSLAFSCGFNSKSSFNTVFKKFEGVSPREYIGKQKSRKV